MTVKILHQSEKDSIISRYQSKQWTQKDLAFAFRVSERTINRVLNEAGIATAVPRIKGEAYRALKTLEKHNILVDDLDTRLSQPTLTETSVLEYLFNLSQEELVTLLGKVLDAQMSEQLRRLSNKPIPRDAQMAFAGV